jgi:hypothetical protein
MIVYPRPAGVAPDLVQPVVGYRLWRLDEDGLCSPYIAERWKRGVHTAVCRAEDAAHDDAVPGHDCTCGIYAWYEPCLILGWAATRHLVAGAVALWGEIELHPFGMRARQAMVVALAVPPWRGTKWRRIMNVARDLDVDAVPARRVKAEALRHGAPVPPGMAPKPRATRVGYAVDQHLGASAGPGWRASSLITSARRRADASPRSPD